MDHLIALIAEVIWPITVLVLAFGFRAELRALVARVSRVSYGSAAVELKELRDEVATEKAKQLPAESTEPVPTNRFDRRLAELNELVDKSPRAAVMEAWIELERAIFEAARRHGVSESNNFREVLRGLADRRAVPVDYLNTLDELRRIRNTAAHAHSFDFSAPAAADFVNTAITLAFLIDLTSSRPRMLP